MYVTQVHDPKAFLKKARLAGEIRVLRLPTAVPVTAGGAVVMHPAIEITYTVQFEDKNAGESSWIYRETRLADERGEVQLGGTLLDQVQRSDPGVSPVRVVLMHRSGSI